MTQLNEQLVAETPLAVVVQQVQLEPATGQHLLAEFEPMFSEARQLCDQAGDIIVTDATQVTEIKASRAMRLELRSVRLKVENTRKRLKEDSLKIGKAIDGMSNVFKLLVEPVEDRLLKQEQFAERVEAERKAKIRASRETLLSPFGIDTSFYNLADMPDAVFAQLLDSSRTSHEMKLAAAQKAEAERIATEAAWVAEDKRIREENEKLRLEKIAAEKAAKIERERIEAERVAAAESARKEREAIEAKAREEARVAKDRADAAAAQAKAEQDAIRAKAETEARKAKAKADADARIAAEKARKEREEAEAKLKAEREARQAAEAKIKAEQEVARRSAVEEAEAVRRAAAAPDREKMLRECLQSSNETLISVVKR